MSAEKKGTEGFYLDEKGEPQDKEFHGACEPSDPEGYTQAMWEVGRAIGMPEALLEHAYGAAPKA